MRSAIEKLIFGAVFVSTMFLNDQYVFSQGIEVENKLPQAVPLKVEFKHHDTENWVRNLRIKVTNVGKKSIYYLDLRLNLDILERGSPVAFAFSFGEKKKFYSPYGLANDDDPVILPGGSYEFRVKANLADAWDRGKKSRVDFYQPRKGELSLSWLDFGDGTGIEGGGTTDRKKAILDKKH